MIDKAHPKLVFVGSDHGGWGNKDSLITLLSSKGYVVEDCSGAHFDPEDDYPPVAFKVAEKVQYNRNAMGVLLCRSGSGMIMAANRVQGIRAAVAHTEQAARHARTDNDANVLSVSADWLSQEQIEEIVIAFLEQQFFGEERHKRRISQIHAYEKK